MGSTEAAIVSIVGYKIYDSTTDGEKGAIVDVWEGLAIIEFDDGTVSICKPLEIELHYNLFRDDASRERFIANREGKDDR